jgi:hypothetical protein
LNKNVGFYGRMISGSKSGYKRINPDNFVIFNANICTATEKVWWGDLDLTLSKNQLIASSIESNEDLYIFYEMDARFDKENNFNLSNAAAIFHADGTYEIGSNYKSYYKL